MRPEFRKLLYNFIQFEPWSQGGMENTVFLPVFSDTVVQSYYKENITQLLGYFA